MAQRGTGASPRAGRPFAGPEVDAAFERYPPRVRAQLLALRQLIFDTAAATEGVGTLEETLKWGQPAYLTRESRSGSTIRIDRLRSNEGQVALYVHCQTSLIATFKELYPNEFAYRANRAIVLRKDVELSERPLAHCIALALTYHLRKRSRPAR